jgi:hypothetical protein
VGPEGVAGPAADAHDSAAAAAAGSVSGLGVRLQMASADGCIGSGCTAKRQSHYLPTTAAAAVVQLAFAPISMLPAAPPPPPSAAVADEEETLACRAQQRAVGVGPASRPLQRHVSWKTEVDVLNGGDSSSSMPCSLQQPPAASGCAKKAEAQSAAAADARNSLQASAPIDAHIVTAQHVAAQQTLGVARAPSALPACESDMMGRTQADMAALLQQHAAAAATTAGAGEFCSRIGSSCDGGQPKCTLAHGGGTGAGAHATAPQPVVMRLSAAALALAADLQQQQQRQESEGSTELTLSNGRSDVQHYHQQWQSSKGPKALPHSGRRLGPGLVPSHPGFGEQQAELLYPGFGPQQAPGSVTGTADDGSSCCGLSDLSAMANPVAYADMLRERMMQHLGPSKGGAGFESGSGVGASGSAAGFGDTRPSAMPAAAVDMLERYLEGHQGLKQKAGGGVHAVAALQRS